MEQYFPGDACVLACSGPSLNNVDVFSLNLPIVVVSTAIRKIPKPHFWTIADNLNAMHGPEGKNAWNDISIKKIVPENKAIKGDSSFIRVPYASSGKQGEISKTLFEPGYPLLRGPHKTVTFVIQWLHLNGIKKIIFAGNDLTADTFESKYAYKLEAYDMRKRGNFKKTLDQVTKTLKVWYPIALQKNFEWYSWKCGHVFESMVPKFTEELEKQYTTIKKIEITTETVCEVIKINKEEKQLNSERLLKETISNLKKTIESNVIISEDEWKEKCKRYLKTI